MIILSSDFLLTRRSVKKYKSDAVPQEKVDKILACGTNAPTGMNRQSPIIVSISDKKTIAILEKENARVLGNEAIHPFYGAPVLVVVFRNPDISTGFEDACLVMGNLLNAAHCEGLGACWIHRAKEVFEAEIGKQFMKQWGVPENFIGVGNCIIGYSDEVPTEKARKKDYVINVK